MPGNTDDSNKADSLRLIIEEQRRDYDYLLHIYDRMRATEGVLLTVAFAILAYLYSSGPDGSILTRLSVPSEDYGIVIYIIAAAFFGYGLIRLMMNVFGNNPWETAYDSAKKDYTYESIETLRYVRARYDKCHDFNCNAYMKRKRELSFLFFCILISATILIVIKTLE